MIVSSVLNNAVSQKLRSLLLLGGLILPCYLFLLLGSVLPVCGYAPVETTIVKPERIVPTVNGTNTAYFVDFGEASFASLSFSLTATAAVRINLSASEKVSATGIVTNDTGPRVTNDTLTTIVGTKTFTRCMRNDSIRPFRGFTMTLPSTVTLDTASIRMNTVHVPFRDSASAFSCSDTVLNRVWALCKHTIKTTSFCGVYIDGDREHTPYEGDAYITMLTHYALDTNPQIALFTNTYLLAHPTWPWEYKLAMILIAWEIYMTTGNASQLSTNYATLQNKLQTTVGSQTLCIDTGLGAGSKANALLVDWPDVLRDGFVFLKRANVVGSSWAYKAYSIMADIAGVLGKTSDSVTYRTRAAATLKAITDSLYMPASGGYRDCMGTNHISLHGNLYPLAFGAVPDSIKGKIASYLVSRGMVCNVYAAQFLLDALFNAEQADSAIALMAARNTVNSWGNMLYRKGATMTMEVWSPSEKPGSSTSNPLDWEHPWGTAAGNIIPRRLFGIMPIIPAYSYFMIKPQVGYLTSGSYTLPIQKGAIRVAFQAQKNLSLTLNLTIPSGTAARVYVPVFSYADNYVRVDGSLVTGTRGGNFISVDSIGPGLHTVVRSSTIGVRERPATGPNGMSAGLKGNLLTVRLPGAGTVTVSNVKGVIVARSRYDESGGAAAGRIVLSTAGWAKSMYCISFRGAGRECSARILVK